MPKTGLNGFGNINEGVFYGKLREMSGREITARDKQQISRTMQKEQDAGRVLYYVTDRSGAVSLNEKASPKDKNIAAKAISIGMTDKKNQALFAYVCQQPGGRWSSAFVGTKNAILEATNAYHIGYMQFSGFRAANDFICGLQEMLLPGEQWGFSRSEENPALTRRCTRYQILESYLRHTFTKLMQEYRNPKSDNAGKIVFSREKKYCYFNTGLLTRYAQELFLTGEVVGMKENGIFTCRNPRFVDSKIELVRSFGFAQKEIDPGPGVASFYRSVTEVVFDPSLTIDFTESKLEHIIDDGIRRGRFPKKYTVNQAGKEIAPWSLAQMLKNSIQTAGMMAQRNYKYVIPQYRPAGQEIIGGRRVRFEGQIQFLMPIYLSADYDSPPDFALVLSRKDGFYVPETILLLPWAYNNARILCRPDNNWLTPSLIDPEDLLREMDEEAFIDEALGAEDSMEEPAEPTEEKSAAVNSRKKQEKPEKREQTKKTAAEEKTTEKPLKEKKKAPEKAETEKKQRATVKNAVGRVLTVKFVGTTSSHALRVQGEGLIGTISQKKLGEHKPSEFHGLSGEVRVISRNSNGNTYQCEFAQEPEEILARRKPKPQSAPKPEKTEKNSTSDQTKKTETSEDSVIKPEKQKKSLVAIWANLFSGDSTPLTPNAPETFEELCVGQKYNAVVRDLVPYGAFVDIGYQPGNVLLHKSQYAPGAVPIPGDQFTVWIYALDEENKKVQVTMNRV